LEVMRSAMRIFVEEPEWWEDNIKMVLREMG
jgi:hypothetical protein